jgi:acyl carrier protein
MGPAFDTSVFDKVTLAVEQTIYVNPLEITTDTRLVDDLGLGRFGRMRLAVQLEEVFDLELPNDVVGRFVTVADIVGYFSRRYFRDYDTRLPAFAA